MRPDILLLLIVFALAGHGFCTYVAWGNVPKRWEWWWHHDLPIVNAWAGLWVFLLAPYVFTFTALYRLITPTSKVNNQERP